MPYLARAEQVASLSLIALTFCLPFFFIPVSWMSIGTSKTLLVAVAAAVATVAWALASLSAGTVRVPRSGILFGSVLLLLAYLLSGTVSGDLRTSFIGNVGPDTVVAVSFMVALIVVASRVFSDEHARLLLALRALLGGGAALLLLEALHLALPSLTFGGVLVGVSASPLESLHDFAVLCGLFFFLSLALRAIFGERDLYRRILSAVTVVAGLMLVMANSSDVWLALGLLAIACAAYLWRYAPEEKRAILGWVLLAVATLGMSVGGSFIHDRLPSAVQANQYEVRPSWQGTFLVGQSTLSSAGRIFFGSGPNTFPHQWNLYKPSSVNMTDFWNIDFASGVGSVPTSVVTAGALALIAWIAILFSLFGSVRSVFTAESDRSGTRALRPVLLGGALYLAIFQVLYVPGPTLTALTFLFFGLLLAEGIHTRSVREEIFTLSFKGWRGYISVGLIGICALGVLLGSIQAVRTLMSNALVDRAVSLYDATSDFSAATRSLQIALLVEPNSDRAHRAAVEMGILQLTKLVAVNDTSDTAKILLQKTLSDTIQHGLEAISIGDRNYQNWLELAYLYGQLAGVGVEGAADSAKAAYEKAAAENPTNPLPLVGLAQLDLLAHDDASARTHLAAALALKQNLPMAHYLLSQIEARQGELALAAADASAAAQLSPEDPVAWYNLGTVLYTSGDNTKAAAALERAVGLQNNYANALFLLTLSYYKLGRVTDATEALQQVAALNPDNREIAAMLAALKAGRDPISVTQ